MSKHAISGTVLCLAATFILSPADALTQQELVAKLQAAGYSQVGEGKSTAEGYGRKGGEGRQGGHLGRR